MVTLYFNDTVFDSTTSATSLFQQFGDFNNFRFDKRKACDKTDPVAFSSFCLPLSFR